MPTEGLDLTVRQLLEALEKKFEDDDGSHNALGIDSESDWQAELTDFIGKSTTISARLRRMRNYHQNMTRPANRLPFEIMETIFLHLRRERNAFELPLPQRWSRCATGRRNEWIRISHVCRRWRMTALNSKLLWRCIVLTRHTACPGALALESIARSEPLPITLEHEPQMLPRAVHDGDLDTFYTFLLNNPHRIAALTLRGKFHDTAWEILKRPLPVVVEVSLSFETLNTSAGDVPINNTRVDKFLGGAASPTLRKLYLDSYAWPTVTLPSLTHLFLRDGFWDDVAPLEFLAVLSQVSSSLEVLYLDGGGPFVEDPEGASFLPENERIRMPFLQHVQIHQEDETFHFALLFLHNLSCPNLKKIVWDALFSDLHPDHSAQLHSCMLPPAGILSKITALVCPSGYGICDIISGNKFFLGIDEDIEADLAEVITSLGHCLPNVHLLALSESHGRAYRVHLSILHSYRSITSLHIAWEYDNNLVSLLKDLEDTTAYDKDPYSYDEANIICPHLRSLTFYTSRWSIKEEVEYLRSLLKESRLRPLKLSSRQSMTRKRKLLGTSYTLQFRFGDFSDWGLSDA